MTFLALAPLALSLSAAAPQKSRAEAPQPLPEFAALVERWEEVRETLHVPGLAVVVVRDDEIVLLETFGVRDVVREQPVTRNTAFYIASCTKTYVALRLVALSEAGLVDLDAPVVTYLPHMELSDTAMNETLTVRDLLCHAKGINCHPCVFLDAFTGEITEERYFRHLRRSRPSGRTDYGNVHFTLAGRIIEAVSGEPWRDDLARNLFEPAGMLHTTGYADEMYEREDVAYPSQWDGERFVLDSVRKTDRTMHAAGGLGTSAHDLGQYLRLLLNGGEVDGQAIVSPEGLEDMFTLHAQASRRDSAYRAYEGFGLSWLLGTFGEFGDVKIAQHGGGYSGSAALISFLPEMGIGVGVLANTSGTGHQLCNLVTDDLYAQLLGLELLEWRREAEETLARSAQARGARYGGAVLGAAKGDLSLAREAYLGRYSNELWGTFVVAEGKGG